MTKQIPSQVSGKSTLKKKVLKTYFTPIILQFYTYTNLQIKTFPFAINLTK